MQSGLSIEENSRIFDSSREKEMVAKKRKHWIVKGKAAGLKACTCYTHSLEAREGIESAIVDQIKENFSELKERQLLIMSVGSGKLLQDYILMKKLIFLGFKNIELTLIDPLLEKKNVDALIQLVNAKNSNKGFNVSIQSFQNSEKCLSEDVQKKYHAIYGIDFIDLPSNWEMFLKAKERLNKVGFIYLSCRNSRICMKEESFILKNCHGEERKWLTNFVEKNDFLLRNNEKIKIAVSSLVLFEDKLFDSLAVLIGKGFKLFDVHLKWPEQNLIVEKINHLCRALMNSFSGVSINIEEIIDFEDEAYNVMAVSSSTELIDQNFLHKEKIYEKMKPNGVLFLDYSPFLIDKIRCSGSVIYNTHRCEAFKKIKKNLQLLGVEEEKQLILTVNNRLPFYKKDL
jgi:hypothetical protein